MKEFIINELAKQAGIVPIAIHNNPLVVSYHMSHETMDKFAKLIVQECATVIERNLFQGIGWNTSRAVKQHFGIDNDD